MASKRILILGTNYGLWGEELQGPWDVLKGAGHALTLATPLGKKPLPLVVSVDPDFFDPVQKYKVNPPEVCARIKALVDGDEWAHSVKFADAQMDDYDAIVLTGGLGAMIDMCNNWHVHRLLMEAYRSDKLIGSLCYAVTALAFCRDPNNDHRSIIWGKTVTAHPFAWDFYGPDYDFTYELYGANPDNPGTDVHTPGFLWPAEYVTRDAVGPNGRVIARASASREDPEVAFDWPFVTGTSVESSIAYGEKIASVLAERP